MIVIFVVAFIILRKQLSLKTLFVFGPGKEIVSDYECLIQSQDVGYFSEHLCCFTSTIYGAEPAN